LLHDVAALERFILERLTKMPGVSNIRSSFALKQVRYKTALPLPASGLTLRNSKDDETHWTRGIRKAKGLRKPEAFVWSVALSIQRAAVLTAGGNVDFHRSVRRRRARRLGGAASDICLHESGAIDLLHLKTSWLK